MLNPILEKAVALILILLLPTTFLFSQATPEELFPKPEAVQSEYTAAQGRSDGERDAKGNPLYACAGAACGALGVVFAVLNDPKLPASVVQELEETKGEAYATSYELAYSKKAKKRNVMWAGAGWVVVTAVSFGYMTSHISRDAD